MAIVNSYKNKMTSLRSTLTVPNALAVNLGCRPIVDSWMQALEPSCGMERVCGVNYRAVDRFYGTGENITVI